MVACEGLSFEDVFSINSSFQAPLAVLNALLINVVTLCLCVVEHAVLFGLRIVASAYVVLYSLMEDVVLFFKVIDELERKDVTLWLLDKVRPLYASIRARSGPLHATKGVVFDLIILACAGRYRDVLLRAIAAKMDRCLVHTDKDGVRIA